MKFKRTVYIDPGRNGGFAWQDSDCIEQVIKMPATDIDILDELRSIRVSGVSRCVIEKQFFHMKGNSALSSAKFARHCGLLMGIAVALGFSVEEITPKKWMPKLGAVPKDKKQRKNWIKDITQKKYPHLKVILATSDALGMMIADESEK